MTDNSYEYYIDFVTKRYFDGVDNHDIDTVLDCFHEDATLTEVTSMTAHEGRDTGIRAMFEGFMGAHSRIWHGNFVHTCDTGQASICSQFSVEVTPQGKSEPLRYENCNRFYLKDGKFSSVFIYMSGENLLK
ncbi:MAG: ketosteroid isomerase-like protein [Alcanivorax sp.]|jgi:ketosteroid isomerase-like protein